MRTKRGGTDPDRPCLHCGQPSISHNLCPGHYKQQNRGRPITPLRKYVKTSPYWKNLAHPGNNQAEMLP